MLCLLLYLGVFSLTVFLSNLLITHFQLATRSPTSRTLSLRELTCPPQLLLLGNTQSNRFVGEFNTLFEFLSNILDYAVMKYVDQAVPMLSKQEGKHAVLHLSAIKSRKQEGEAALRWKWFTTLADFLLLRCGPSLGISLCLHIEAAAAYWFYFPLVYHGTTNCMQNLFVFHGMEEVEHGALTVQELRKRTNLLMNLIGFPLVIIVHIVLMLFPPIVYLIQNPADLLVGTVWMELMHYYVCFGWSFIMSTWLQIVHALLPFGESQGQYEKMQKFYEQETKRRGITFNVVETESYPLK